MRALLLAPRFFGAGQGDGVANSQIWPFYEYRRVLRRQLGMDFVHRNANTFRDIEAAVKLGIPADVLFVRPSWEESPAAAEKAMRVAREAYPQAKIVFIDPFDQTSSRFFGVLPYVDWLLKYICLKDNALYREPYEGGSYLTHRLAREFGYEVGNWHVGSPVPPGQESKIVPGWFAIPRDVVFMITRLGLPWALPWRRKDIDVCCHVSVNARDDMQWYGHLRKASIDELRKLGDGYKLSINADFIGEPRISRKGYLDHMSRARIAFSPFGWGEVTGRSFEAVRFGSLYMTPDCSHVVVDPDMIQPHKTYVPVKWDYSDLNDACRHYLAHPEEADTIIRNARRVFVDYYRGSRFVDRIAELVGSPRSEALRSIRERVA